MSRSSIGGLQIGSSGRRAVGESGLVLGETSGHERAALALPASKERPTPPRSVPAKQLSSTSRLNEVPLLNHDIIGVVRHDKPPQFVALNAPGVKTGIVGATGGELGRVKESRSARHLFVFQ